MNGRLETDVLRREAREAFWRGECEKALAAAETGLALARRQADRLTEELFLCNRATVWIEVERHDFSLARLKEIVLGSSSRFNASLAAYVVANAEESRRHFERARFYAETALRNSAELGYRELMGVSLGLLGRLNAKQSRLRDAQDFYLKSLEVLEAADELSPNAACVLDEVGYCCILLNETRAGFSYLGRSLSTCDRLGLRRAKDYPSLDMCFARLRNGDFEEAETWGWKALELGREYGREDIIKNSLYLLAESCWRLGRRSDADHHYDALAQYYPEFPALKDYLRQVDLTSVLSLF